MGNRFTSAVALALVIAACGSGDSADTTTTLLPPVSTTAPATTTTAPTTTTTTTAPVDEQEAAVSPQLAAVRAAMSRSSEVTSARMEGLIEVTGLQGGVEISLSMPFGGAFDSATGNSSFSMDLSSLAAASEATGEEIPPEFAELFGEMEVREVDGISYIKFPFFSMLFGAETPWISAPAEEGGDLTSSFTFAQPNDPGALFGDLADADAEVTEIGMETVNGVEATHYRVVFDAAKLYEEASPEERAELEESGTIPVGDLPMDLWITGDGIVVRYLAEIDGSAVSAPEGEEFERMVMRFDLLDIGQPVEILPPDPAEVTPIEELGAGLLGGFTDQG